MARLARSLWRQQLTPAQATDIWEQLSQCYASEASGNAIGFTQGAKVNSIFNRIEYPELLANPNITNILTGGF
jgi:hypothetical protein